MYKVNVGYTKTGRERSVKVATLKEASDLAQKIFTQTGIVVAVEKDSAK